MLASPLLPASHNFGSHGSQHAQEGPQPAKDLPTFKKMLEPAVEFVEGSSSGAYVGLEGKYQPINVAAPLPPKTPAKPEKNADPKPTPAATPAPVPPTPKAQGKTLWPATIDTTWPSSCNVGSGLHNLGNTCFLNSALQCLLHTPPLLHILNGHTKDTCRNDKFCMTCSLRDVARQAHSGKRAFAPTSITNRLQTIAKHMRKGRQEDTHEFLRYAIDALQKACLFGHPPKIDPKLAETTWVHKIFGGRLRSRVTCRECEHNSDTFDRILDLSLDIFKVETVKDALKKFVAIDYLKGADKYKCEKCKKPVVAEKRFTIHEAPVVLTVHLKRFSPLGRKIAHHIDYDEKLSLAPYMSDGQYGPSYSLYGVICHAGSGPNSGHYYAFVKSRDGKWYEMNDDSVTPSPPPLNKKSAYMLFYIRDKGQGLEAAVKSKSVGGREQSSQRPARITDGMKGQKRKEREEDAEDVGVKVENPVLGPLLASPTINGDSKKLRGDDPQARAIKAKIEAAAAKKKVSSTLSGLTQYNSDDNDSNSDDGKDDEKEPGEIDSSPSKDANMDSSPPKPPRTSSPNGDGPNGIAPSSFYGSNRPPKKRKSSDQWQDRGEKKRPFGTPKGKVQYGNPYSGLTTYSSKNKRRRAPRGI
ncbi:hypothetical protein D9611_002504 [Ephemerocybe angulata]|uniref:Ubiquitin carboxyl-terminal hydrolase n=1 Tax=Ephemerocybe angulata TaxID=980116 RepID=A0A8H5C1Q9_9AGAR|nr:hypothetical protein D9611_002504 [Tulosesus angulatus]